jgi:hypothetical protein
MEEPLSNFAILDLDGLLALSNWWYVVTPTSDDNVLHVNTTNEAMDSSIASFDNSVSIVEFII